jgi:hypothetical protein
MTINHFRGRCHCGNLEVEFDTDLPLERLSLRADQCSFCTKHGARTTSDPSGHVKIIVHDPRLLIQYRFGLATADFLVCKRCGIYVAAVLLAGDSCYATLNVNALDRVSEFTQRAIPVSYDSETRSERAARRVTKWTPAAVEMNS